MLSKFFINRPIFAWVVALLISLAGILAIKNLPLSQYPELAPPIIMINATYPGASSDDVENSVTQVLERSLTGIDNLTYMTATSQDGASSIYLIFDTETDPNTAQVQVQNRIQSVQATLPQEVQSYGVEVRKAGLSMEMVLAFVSDKGQMSDIELNDYVNSSIKDMVARLEGVGNVRVFSPPKALRIWLNNNDMRENGVTTQEVIKALKAQNVIISVGSVGSAPSIQGQQVVLPVKGEGLFSSVEQFENAIIKANPDVPGSLIRLKDVAKVEIGLEKYNIRAFYNGKKAVALGIQLAHGANALETIGRIKNTVKRMESSFPKDMKVAVPFDVQPFVRIAIKEVVKTLVEAVLLVVFVIYLFLQNWRATLVPSLAIPVVLLGTLAVMQVLGYSINTMTMFGIVLAIGLLVDDAIVVVENVERIMHRDNISAKEATLKSMQEIQGALIGITMVISAILVPMAFFKGSAGVIFRQFSIPIVSAMVLSVITALTFTPAVCASILKPVKHKNNIGPIGWFNRKLDNFNESYTSFISKSVKKPSMHYIAYIGILGIIFLVFPRIPNSMLSEEDIGGAFSLVELPMAASKERTEQVLQESSEYFLNTGAVDGVLSVAGTSFTGAGENQGLAFIQLKPWSERSKDQNSKAIVVKAAQDLKKIKDAKINVFNPPPIMGLSNVSSIEFYLIDYGNLGRDKLIEASNSLVEQARKTGMFLVIGQNQSNSATGYKLNVDKERAQNQGIDINELKGNLSAYISGSYIGDYVDHGSTKKVMLQARAEDRLTPENIKQIQVRRTSSNHTVNLVNIGEYVQLTQYPINKILDRYNGMPAIKMMALASPGHTNMQGMDVISNIVNKLPKGVSLQWSGMSHQERSASSGVGLLYLVSLIVIFLCLAALYESWSLPMSVIFIVPLGVLGSVLLTWISGLSNDIYFKVGLLIIAGLSAKNAILIVEFAKEQMEKYGKNLIDATLEGARLRLRPILMTSLAFALGVTPLVISSGPSANAQHSVGTGLMGGTISSMLLSIVFTPIFFVTIQRIFKSTKVTK